MKMRHFTCFPKLPSFLIYLLGEKSLANASFQQQKVNEKQVVWKTAGKMNQRWPFKEPGHTVKRWSSPNPAQLLWYVPWMPKAVQTRCFSHLWAARIQGWRVSANSWSGLGELSQERGRSLRWHSLYSQKRFAESGSCSNAEAIWEFSQHRPHKPQHVLRFDLSQH